MRFGEPGPPKRVILRESRETREECGSGGAEKTEALETLDLLCVGGGGVWGGFGCVGGGGGGGFFCGVFFVVPERGQGTKGYLVSKERPFSSEWGLRGALIGGGGTQLEKDADLGGEKRKPVGGKGPNVAVRDARAWTWRRCKKSLRRGSSAHPSADRNVFKTRRSLISSAQVGGRVTRSKGNEKVPEQVRYRT